VNRNQRLAVVRLWLHDRICVSECEGDRARDHARRTQHDRARAIVDAENRDGRRRAVHDAVCISHMRGADCYEQHRPDVLDQLLAEVDQILKEGSDA